LESGKAQRKICNAMEYRIQKDDYIDYTALQKKWKYTIDIVYGVSMNRKDEDEYRLMCDRTIGSFMPLVGMGNYSLKFWPVLKKGSSDYKVVELKVSVGQKGEIYEDGLMKVYLVDTGLLIGPLHPQEIKELVLLKHKENIEGAEEARRFMTPAITEAKAKARVSADDAKKKAVPVQIKRHATVQHETMQSESTPANSVKVVETIDLVTPKSSSL